MTPFAIGDADGQRVFVVQPTDAAQPRLAPGDVVSTHETLSPGTRVEAWTLEVASGNASSLETLPGLSASAYVEWFMERNRTLATAPAVLPEGPLPPIGLERFLWLISLPADELPVPERKLADGALEEGRHIIFEWLDSTRVEWEAKLDADPHGAEKLARSKRLAGLTRSRREGLLPVEHVTGALNALEMVLLAEDAQARFAASMPSSEPLRMLYELADGPMSWSLQAAAADANDTLSRLEDRYLVRSLPRDLLALYAVCGGIAIATEPDGPSGRQAMVEPKVPRGGQRIAHVVVPPSGVQLLETARPLLRLGSCGAFQYAMCPKEGSVWQVPCGQGDEVGRCILSPFLSSGEISAEPTKIADSLADYLASVAERGGRPPVVPFVNLRASASDVAATRAMLEAETPSDLHGRWVTSLTRMSALIEAEELVSGQPLQMGPPLSAAELGDLERELGVAIPRAFASALTNVAGTIRMSWSAETTAPGDLRDVDQGGSDAYGIWDASALVEMNAWVREDGVEDVLVFTGSDGTYIGIAMDEESDDAPVVYLDEMGDEFLLAPDFDTFMTRWTSLGCPGTDLYCLRPFLVKGELIEGGLADEWRDWLYGGGRRD